MALPTDTAGPFDVRTDDLIHIDADQAVDLFRQLLVIEAVKVGIPVTNVDVPAAINVADGGIDAEVSGLSGAVLPAGLISEGLTRYQIKTGSFSASTASDIRSLLVQPKFAAGAHQRTKGELQPRVLNCFEKGGTFVVVLFGSDLVGTADDHGATQISEFMVAICKLSRNNLGQLAVPTPGASVALALANDPLQPPRNVQTDEVDAAIAAVQIHRACHVVTHFRSGSAWQALSKLFSVSKSSTYACMERVKGIEPSYEAWEAAVLPLNYTRSIADYRQHLQALHPMPVWLWSGCRDACWAVVAAAEMRERFDTLQPYG